MALSQHYLPHDAQGNQRYREGEDGKKIPIGDYDRYIECTEACARFAAWLAPYQSPKLSAVAVTKAPQGSPSITTRERDVLVVLCRPLLDRDLFTEPASIREIASALVVSEAAVKQHLARLYDKFGVDATDHRRARLANEALRRGAVTLADLHRSSHG